MRKRLQSSSILTKVESIRMLMPRIGTRKLYHLLKEELEVGRDKLFSILRANHMLIKASRSYHKTTDSKHWLKKHSNKVKGIKIESPEQVWVSDITYIGKRDRHCYLSLVTDAYSRKIMGYDLSDSLQQQGCLRAMQMALKNRKYTGKQLVHHSDRGSQYCSHDYQKLLEKNKVICSMTENADPYENAVAERVNGILKLEFLLEKYDVKFDMMKKIVKQSIDIYNTLRPHLSCNMMTPQQRHDKK